MLDKDFYAQDIVHEAISLICSVLGQNKPKKQFVEIICDDFRWQRADSFKVDTDGVIRVANTRVTFDSVVGAFLERATAEEIAQQYPTVELAGIYAIIGCSLRRESGHKGGSKWLKWKCPFQKNPCWR